MVEHFNVTLNRPSLETVDALTLELIAEHNALDIELYSFAQEIFEGQRAAYGAGFDADLARLQLISATASRNHHSATNR